MKGKLFILVGPSGSGKSSIIAELKMLRPQFTYPLSATTRPMRDGEREGELYHFYSKEQFEQGIHEGRFLEYAVVHQDHFYGLIKEPILEALAQGKTIVREIDIQGFDSLRREISPENRVAIFISAGSREELAERIVKRSAISPEELEKRKQSMLKEFARSRDCDYLVENKNGELGRAVQKVIGIIESGSAGI